MPFIFAFVYLDRVMEFRLPW